MTIYLKTQLKTYFWGNIIHIFMRTDTETRTEATFYAVTAVLLRTAVLQKDKRFRDDV